MSVNRNANHPDIDIRSGFLSDRSEEIAHLFAHLNGQGEMPSFSSLGDDNRRCYGVRSLKPGHSAFFHISVEKCVKDNLYSGFSGGRAPVLPAVPVECADDYGAVQCVGILGKKLSVRHSRFGSFRM